MSRINDRLIALEARYDEINTQLSDPNIYQQLEKLQKLGQEQARLKDVIGAGRRWRSAQLAVKEAQQMAAQESEPGLVAMAREEERSQQALIEEAEKELKLLLIPSDPNDDRNVVMEIRAGSGGAEASLFAAELFRMYNRYSETRHWQVGILSSSESEGHGFKEVIFEIHGQGAFSRLKFESGVHRVQRVPETESQGRVHTSAASVVVLPEADEVDVTIDEKELKIDVYRSTGPGGQSVNTTDSAVRITHIPTGLVVTCQDEKSQHKNRAKALRVLRARLFDLAQAEQQAELTETRRLAVGSGDRSEKIRTYNFPQSRITDHRIDLTIYQLNKVIEGELDLIVEPLLQEDQARRLLDTDE